MTELWLNRRDDFMYALVHETVPADIVIRVPCRITVPQNAPLCTSNIPFRQLPSLNL